MFYRNEGRHKLSELYGLLCVLLHVCHLTAAAVSIAPTRISVRDRFNSIHQSIHTIIDDEKTRFRDMSVSALVHKCCLDALMVDEETHAATE